MWGWIKDTARKAWRAIKGAASVAGRALMLGLLRLLKGLDLLSSLVRPLRFRKWMEVTVVILAISRYPRREYYGDSLELAQP